MSAPTRRPAARRRPSEPPAEGHRPLRSVGYRVPVVLDEEFEDGLDGDAAPWSPAAVDSPHRPMWEQWDVPAPDPEPPAESPDVPVPVVAPPLPVAETWSQPEPEPEAAGAHAYDDLEPLPPRSLYLSALRVRHLQPGVFQRVLLVEGVLAVAVILALADLASPWLIAVLPVVVAALVKLHDLVQEGVERVRAQNSPGAPPGLGSSGWSRQNS